jgi:hypothetical protein
MTHSGRIPRDIGRMPWVILFTLVAAVAVWAWYVVHLEKQQVETALHERISKEADYILAVAELVRNGEELARKTTNSISHFHVMREGTNVVAYEANEKEVHFRLVLYFCQQTESSNSTPQPRQ